MVIWKYKPNTLLVAQKAEEINHMAQKSAKNMIGHLHRGKAREKIDNNNNNNNNNNNFGRILGMVTSSSSIKAWLVWDYDR